MRVCLWVVVALALSLLAAATAWCADEAPVARETPASKSGGKGPNLVMEDVEIRGELERPDVFYIIPRRKADMDLGTLSRDYTPEIMEPMLPGPFEAAHSQSGQSGQP